MFETQEEIIDYIRKVTDSDFLEGFILRSELHATAYRAGSPLSAEFNEYSGSGYNLTSYAYALLDLGLRLHEMGFKPKESRIAFLFAANSLEASLVTEFHRNNDNKFDRIIAAFSYHLAEYSACSYYLSSSLLNLDDLAINEKILINLMLRDISAMKGIALGYRVSGEGADSQLSKTICDWALIDKVGEDDVEEDFLEECINRSLIDTYCSAISTFLLGIERGEFVLVEKGLNALKRGLDVCKEWNFIRHWWIYRISIYLLKDLWDNSYHKLLDQYSDKDDLKWIRFREIFIAVLYKKPKSEIDLWPSQIDAAERSVNQEDDLIISLPTSSGKTRIAELCILRCVSQKRRAIFVVPLRALASQIEAELKDVLGKVGLSVSAYYDGGGFGEIDRAAFQEYDILVMTPEKLDFATRHDQSVLDDVGLLVFDEGHMIQLDERGVQYEALIQRLLKRRDANSRRIVCLSAVLPDGDKINNFVSWIRKGKIGQPVKASWRPTKLKFGEVIWNESDANLLVHEKGKTHCSKGYISKVMPTKYYAPRRKRRTMFPRDQRELCIATAWKLAKQDQTILIYCPQKNSVEPFAENIVELFERDVIEKVLRGSKSKIESAIAIGTDWFGADSNIVKCLDIGIGIHHASMPKPYLREVERLLSEKILGIVVSSPTLAQGVNLPINSIVMFSVSRYRGERLSPPIDPSEFRNVAGRAGRAFVSSEGLVLYPMFDKFQKRKRDWKSLVGGHSVRPLDSCLVDLVRRLLGLIGDLTNIDLFEEGDRDGSYDWDSIEATSVAQKDVDRHHVLKRHIAMLDNMILSLIGENDIEVKEVDSELDRMLESSLWSKFFRDNGEISELEFLGVVSSRGRYLWNNSTARQRQGYFLAGVGLDVGKKLDKIDNEVRNNIDEFWYFILSNKTDSAAQSIIKVARLVFDLAPFKPRSKPGNWEIILKYWLLGKSLHEVDTTGGSKMIEFIEDGVVFKLSWAISIVHGRVVRDIEDENRNKIIFEHKKFEVVKNVIMAGTLNIPASILVLSGFSIRSVATLATTSTNASFDDRDGLIEWLRSSEVKERQDNASWPTYETHAMWKRYVNRIFPASGSMWLRSDWSIEVRWINERPKDKVPLQIYDSNGSTLILSETGEHIGVVEKPIDPDRVGLTLANSLPNSDKICVTYIGPGDFWIYT